MNAILEEVLLNLYISFWLIFLTIRFFFIKQINQIEKANYAEKILQIFQIDYLEKINYLKNTITIAMIASYLVVVVGIIVIIAMVGTLKTVLLILGVIAVLLQMGTVVLVVILLISISQEKNSEEKPDEEITAILRGDIRRNQMEHQKEMVTVLQHLYDSVTIVSQRQAVQVFREINMNGTGNIVGMSDRLARLYAMRP